MNIIIVLNQPYPNGMACTGRVQLYASAFKYEGHNVEILLPKAKKQNREFGNNIPRGTYEEIPFACFTSSTQRNRFLLIRVFYDIWGPILCALYIIRNHPKVILLVSSASYHKVVFKISSLFTRSLYIHEKSEIPYHKKPAAKLWLEKMRWTKLVLINKLFDGNIMISELLDKYYHDNINRNISSIVIPVIVKTREMDLSYKSPGNKFILVYSGNFTQRQDGVITVLEAFKIIENSYPDIQLIMMGSIESSPDKDKIHSIIQNSGLTNKIKLLGFVSREVFSDQCKMADAFILAKPANRQNTYNFPTKLIEYLSTGKPVITTAVGSIDSILTDNKNAFIARSGDAEDLARKIELVITEPLMAGKVGKEGQRTAFEQFDYILNGKKLISYFEFLLKK
jgi:glycosyltransferase involved in cell wall biosynthesis